MAVQITDAVRRNPPPCAHFRLTIDIDGVRQRQLDIVLSDLDGPVTDEDVKTIVSAWLRYQRSKGVAFSAMLNEPIFQEIV